MSDPEKNIRVELRSVGRATWASERQSEPITVGIPLPAGLVGNVAQLGLEDSSGRLRPLQARALDQWSDGSVRWALLDFQASAAAGIAEPLVLNVRSGIAATMPAEPLQVAEEASGVSVSSAGASFEFRVGGAFPISGALVRGREAINAANSGFRVEHQGVLHRFRITEARLEDRGPLRASVHLRASSDQPGSPVEVWARAEMFSGTPVVRISITIRNPERAKHPGGYWPLGDAGSVLLDSVALNLTTADPIVTVRAAPEWARPLEAAGQPLEIHQESSGGLNWKTTAHCDRTGNVPLRFRGYRRSDAGVEQTGLRATPVLEATTAATKLSIALPKFWQNFPQSVAAGEGSVEIAFHPKSASGPRELQGGEQKTQTVAVSFGIDAVSDPPLAWVHDPLLVYPPPRWCCATDAIPLIVAAEDETTPRYLDLVALGLDNESGFVAKREAADEFGWRNFGDLPADHESAFQPPDKPFVSHFNNQYDAVGAFAIHFLRTGNAEWWHLAGDLARHVTDIDIYHTSKDKSAYNGGLFWHTLHYGDAGISSHRTYPPGQPASGGPSNEHNYNTGLMLHYFMTGDPESRSGALSLAEWVMAMEDGRKSVFGWIDRGPTGSASSTGLPTYHGPGRGAANSIVACLTGHRLTGDGRFKAMAETLIRRCIHPRDDITQRDLPNAELRWSYTVFLQALGHYLEMKHEAQDYDEAFAYARASLLHYARWVVAHERPYLDRPEILEFATETWPAQDLRKAEVLLWAARHAAGPERDAFIAKARYFRDSALETLAGMPTRGYTRPVILLLANGPRLARLEAPALLPIIERSVPEPRTAPSAPFVPQRVRVVRRLAWMAALVGVAVVVAGGWLVASLLGG